MEGQSLKKGRADVPTLQRLRSTLRQCVRDWSVVVSSPSLLGGACRLTEASSAYAQGKEERDTAYQPILDALEEQYKDLNLEQR